MGIATLGESQRSRTPRKGDARLRLPPAAVELGTIAGLIVSSEPVRSWAVRELPANHPLAGLIADLPPFLDSRDLAVRAGEWARLLRLLDAGERGR